jgi:hypothetical protein
MARKLTPAQQATFFDLTDRDGVVHFREAWDGKTLLLGVGMAPDPETNVSTTRMYRVFPDGRAVGV